MSEIDQEFQEHMARLEAFRKGRPETLRVGVEALRRLMRVAQSDTGQSRRVAGFLLCLFNGSRFPYDITDMRGLDLQLFDDCVAVLKMDYSPEQEVHKYFPDGGELFERLAHDWNIDDQLLRSAE